MSYSYLLAIHLGGAAATGLVAAYAAVAMTRGTSAVYKTTSLVLGALAGFEILSGVVLAVASPSITALSICSNVAVYLATVFIVEAFLFVKMQKLAIVFPLKLATSPALASLCLMVAAISYGY